MSSRTAPSLLLLLLLAVPAPLLAATTVHVGFRDAVYRGPATAEASALLVFSTSDGRVPPALVGLRLELPAGGQPLTREWVLAALGKQLPQGLDLVWFGPTALPRAPELQHVDADGLVLAAQTALEAVLKLRSSDYTAQAVARPEAPVLNPGVVSLQARLPADSRLRPRMVVMVDVSLDGVPVRSVPVWFAVKAAGQVPVYAHDMQAEQEPGKDDLRWESRDMAALPSEPLADAATLQGKWLRRTVKAGQEVLVADLTQEPMVRHHQRVEVRLVTGPVAIVAWGTAEDSGNKGDVINVRVDKSEGDCSGRVIDRGVVQIGN